MADTKDVLKVIGGLQGKGFSQYEIARLLGLSRGFVSDLLSSRRKISATRAREVLSRFNQIEPVFVRSAKDFDKLPLVQRGAYLDSLEALRLMRQGRNLKVAASEVGHRPETVLRYVGTALQETRKGEHRVTRTDRFVRPMKILTPEGLITDLVSGPKEASKLGNYWNAVKQYLETGNRKALRPFKGKTIRTADGRRIRLITDEATLRRLADAGELKDLDDIYA